MKETLALFAKWKVEQPAQRQAMFIHSSHKATEENILYMICSWDYVYRPNDEKLMGLTQVFISNKGAGAINVRSYNRKDALNVLEKPQAKVNYEGSNVSAEVKMLRAGGVARGGAGNYNLMTKAIEATLPQCMSKVDTQSSGFSALMAGGTNGKKPTKAALDLVKVVSNYWGSSIYDLVT